MKETILGIEVTELQAQVLREVWKHSSREPITNKQLATRLNFKPRDTGKEGADMRSIMNALRVKGFPVCASGKGYWYAENDHELSKYIGELTGRIKSIEEAVEGLDRAYPIVRDKIKR